MESKVLDAHQFTNSKKGAKNDPDRINRYLIAAYPPQLRQKPTDNGGFKLTEVAKCSDDVTLPSAFQAHPAERRNRRAKTNALRARLACTLVAGVSKDMLRN